MTQEIINKDEEINAIEFDIFRRWEDRLNGFGWEYNIKKEIEEENKGA